MPRLRHEQRNGTPSSRRWHPAISSTSLVISRSFPKSSSKVRDIGRVECHLRLSRFRPRAVRSACNQCTRLDGQLNSQRQIRGPRRQVTAQKGDAQSSTLVVSAGRTSMTGPRLRVSTARKSRATPPTSTHSCGASAASRRHISTAAAQPS